MENAKLLHILGTGEKGEKRDLTSSFSQNPGGSLQVVKCGPPSRGDPPFFFSFFIILRSTVTKCSTEYSWEYNRNTDNITYRTSLTPVSPRPRFLQIVGMCSLSLSAAISDRAEGWKKLDLLTFLSFSGVLFLVPPLSPCRVRIFLK